MRGRLSRIVSIFVAGAVLLAACGNEAPDDASGTVTVFAATSLTTAFTELAKRFEAAHADVTITLNFAASSALLQQIGEGARPDVVALADNATMRTLRADNSFAAPRVFARNRLVIVTKPGNPTNVSSLADLANASFVALCAQQVPCGQYAAEAFNKAGVSIDEPRVTRGQNVAATLSAVSEGDATAAIVYVTDARVAGDRVTAVAIAESHNVVASYPIAARVGASALARGFIEFVQGDDGQSVLRAHGFLEA